MNILIVVAHPDDEVLGCGGTVARLRKENNQIYLLVLSRGVGSRFKSENKRTKILKNNLKTESLTVEKILGIKRTYFNNFPDNKFDSVDLLSIVKSIEKIKKKLKPEIIYTHYANDLNIDHQITYKAVITATRPMFEESVKEIYSFEIPSSTEWNYPLTFCPDVFVDITDTLTIKIKALSAYKNEIRNSPHPRSAKGIRIIAEYWGIKTGLSAAEAFKVVRIIK